MSDDIRHKLRAFGEASYYHPGICELGEKVHDRVEECDYQPSEGLLLRRLRWQFTRRVWEKRLSQYTGYLAYFPGCHAQFPIRESFVGDVMVKNHRGVLK